MPNPVIVSMPNGPGMLHVSVDLAGTTPAAVIQAFTDADLVQQWWGGAELTIDSRPGGRYVARFPRLGQVMRGSVVSLDPAGAFTFTWSWEHEPARPHRRVAVSAEPTTDGVRLRLEHGPYDGGDADREDADSHRQGWEYFLPRLAELLSPAEHRA